MATDRSVGDLLIRQAAQMTESLRLTRELAECERQASMLRGTISLIGQARAGLEQDCARLADAVASRDREIGALRARAEALAAEYRRLTRLTAERAREIFELQLALGRRTVDDRGRP